jgi:hypothetical protein
VGVGVGVGVLLVPFLIVTLRVAVADVFAAS